MVFETNIFDFSDDLYGKTIKLEFLHYIRAEKKFNSVFELSKQVHNDIKLAKQLIKN